MSRKRLAISLSLLAGAGLLTMLLPRHSAAETDSLLGPERQTPVYSGDVQKDLGGIKLTSWGSGEAQAISDGYHYWEGPEVLKVKTQGPYQGVVLRFARPVEIASFLAEKHSFIELRVMPAQPKRVKQAAQVRQAGRRRWRRRPAGGPGGPAASPAGGGGGPGGGTPLPRLPRDGRRRSGPFLNADSHRFPLPS